jgi:threonine dehydrogenase-like Zn-dependent dehydrogenase
VAFKQLRVSGSVGYTAETWSRALRILGEGRVRLGDLITHRLPIEQWERGFAACRDKSALKALLTAVDGSQSSEGRS